MIDLSGVPTELNSSGEGDGSVESENPSRVAGELNSSGESDGSVEPENSSKVAGELDSCGRGGVPEDGVKSSG